MKSKTAVIFVIAGVLLVAGAAWLGKFDVAAPSEALGVVYQPPT